MMHHIEAVEVAGCDGVWWDPSYPLLFLEEMVQLALLTGQLVLHVLAA